MSFTFRAKAVLLGACLSLATPPEIAGQQTIDFDVSSAASILSSGNLNISNVEYSGCDHQFLLLTGIGPIGIDCGMLMSSGTATIGCAPRNPVTIAMKSTL